MNLLNFDIIEPAPEQPAVIKILLGITPILVFLLLVVIVLLIKQIRKQRGK